jgi:rubrerythrin
MRGIRVFSRKKYRKHLIPLGIATWDTGYRNGNIESRVRRERKMLSKIPINLDRMKNEDLGKEILRAAIIAELDAINLYEQMAAMTRDSTVKRLLLDVAREEKTHVGEFQTLLLKRDQQQRKEMGEGEKEVEELLRGRGK